MTKPNLLLVDPDERNRRVLEVSLRKAGFMVTLATDGLEAMQRLEVSCPDLIVSEISLPKLDGVELCRQVRRSKRLANVPIVVLGAPDAMDQHLHALSAGADEFVARPVLLKEIIVRAKMLLERRARENLSVEGGSKTLNGQLCDMAVVDLIQTMELGSRSGVIHLHSTYGRRGAIYFRDGKIIDAELAALQGQQALYRLLIWNEGSFDVELKTIRRKEVIGASNEDLVMEGMRRMDEWERLQEQLPPLDSVFELDYDALADRLGEIPDEVNAIIRLFDGRRMLIEVVDDAEFGDLEAMGVICKLYFEGLLLAVEEEDEEGQHPRPRRRTQRVGGLPAEEQRSSSAAADAGVDADADAGQLKKVDTQPLRGVVEIADAEQEAMEALSSSNLPLMEDIDAAGGLDAEAFSAAAAAAGAVAKEDDEVRSTDRYKQVDFGESPEGELFTRGEVDTSASGLPLASADEIPEVQPMEARGEARAEDGSDLVTLEAGELLPEVVQSEEEQAPRAAEQPGPSGLAAEEATASEGEDEEPIPVDGMPDEAAEEDPLEKIQPFGDPNDSELVKASGETDEVSGEIYIGESIRPAAEKKPEATASSAKQRRRKKRKRQRKTKAAGSGQLAAKGRAGAGQEPKSDVAQQEVEVDRWLEEEGGARGQLIPFPRGRGSEEGEKGKEGKEARGVEVAAKEAAARGDSEDASEASIDVRDEEFFASDYEPDPFGDEIFAEYPSSKGKAGRWVALLSVLLLALGGMVLWTYVIDNPYYGKGPVHLRIDGVKGAPLEAKPRPKKKVAAKVAARAKVAPQPEPAPTPASTAKVAPQPAPAPTPAPSAKVAPQPELAPTPASTEPDYQTLIAKARAALEGRKGREARKLYSAAKKLQAEGWEVLSFYAWRAYNRGRSKQAQQLAARALAKNAKAPYANLVQGAVAHESGKKAKAREAYQRFLDGCPRCPEVKDIGQALKSL